MSGVTVIVPTLDEAASITGLLDALAGQADVREVIVVDGGSADGTADVAARHASAPRVLRAPRGRAKQMNVGASAARGDVLLFLHADTALPAGAVALVARAVARDGVECGCFGLRIASRDVRLRAAAWLITARSRVLRSATGDQALFATHTAFDRVGGYPDWPLFEDMALVARLRHRNTPWRCLPLRVGTSARRWEAHGITRTIVRMWTLRALFHAGVPPATLARWYGRDVRDGDSVAPRAGSRAAASVRSALREASSCLAGR